MLTAKDYYNRVNQILSRIGMSKETMSLLDKIIVSEVKDNIVPARFYQTIAEKFTRYSYSGGNSTRATARTWANIYVAHQFLKTKQIYLFNTHLKDELLASPVPDNLEMSILSHLPFNCFYLAFEYQMESFLVRGVFLIRDKDRLYCFCDVDKNHEPDMLFVPIIVNLAGVYGEVHQRVHKMNIDFLTDNNYTELEVDDKKVVNQHLKQYSEDFLFTTRSVVNLLMYLVSDKADVAYSSSGAKKKKDVSKHVSVNKVGFNISYYKSFENRSNGNGDDAIGGTAKSTHLRRGHWHTYLCGKNKTQQKLVWVLPTVVNADKGDLPSRVTRV